MIIMKELLKTKEKIKKKNPNFTRSDSHKKPKLGTKWRKPKGMHNKMRLQKRGYKVIVKSGYRTPKATRLLDREGKATVLISNVAELAELKKDQKVIISSKLGTKKRIEIIDACKKENITIANFKDPQKHALKIKEKLTSKKTESLTKKEQRTQKKQKAEKAKKTESEKSVDEKVDEEEKKSREKKEKDKLLIQKEQ